MNTATETELKTFDCRYAMYLNHRGVKSKIKGFDLIDAIKKSNPNAILVWVQDTDGVEYFCNEHDKPDRNGYFNYFWTDKNGNVIYDSNEEPEKLVVSTDITATDTDSGWIAPDGSFYECGFEQHYFEAKKIVDFKQLAKGVQMSVAEGLLVERGWIKLSSGDVRFSSCMVDSTKITEQQKATIVNYFLSKKCNSVKLWGDLIALDDFLTNF